MVSATDSDEEFEVAQITASISKLENLDKIVLNTN